MDLELDLDLRWHRTGDFSLAWGPRRDFKFSLMGRRLSCGLWSRLGLLFGLLLGLLLRSLKRPLRPTGLREILLLLLLFLLYLKCKRHQTQYQHMISTIYSTPQQPPLKKKKHNMYLLLQQEKADMAHYRDFTSPWRVEIKCH